MATVNLLPVKGVQEKKAFDVAHAQRIFDLQKKCPPVSWKLADEGYVLVDGVITAKPADVAPAAGTPAAGTPAAGTPAAGTPAAGVTATNTPASTTTVNNSANGPANTTASTGADKSTEKQG